MIKSKAVEDYINKLLNQPVCQPEDFKGTGDSYIDGFGYALGLATNMAKELLKNQVPMCLEDNELINLFGKEVPND